MEAWINIILISVCVTVGNALDCQMDQLCEVDVGEFAKIVSPTDVNDLGYQISTPSRTDAVYFIAKKADLNIGGDPKECYVKIDGIDIKGGSDISFRVFPSYLNNRYMVFIDAKTSATDCSWEFWGFVYSTKHEELQAEILTDDSGSISTPKWDNSDLNNIFGYRFMIYKLWTITLSDPSAVIEINITKLDLGRVNEVKDYNPPDTEISEMDHLIIGSGDTVLAGSDNVFYGHWDTAIHLTVPSTVAHIFFVSVVHCQDVSGFDIKYQANYDSPLITTTTEETTTLLQLPSQAWAPLDGFQSIVGNPTTTNDFKNIVAELTNGYVAANNISLSNRVQGSDVDILDMKTCSTSFCQKDCVAVQFQIQAKDLHDNWALDQTQLQEILKFKPDSWSALGKNVELCDEHPEMNVGLLVGLLVAVIGGTVVVGVAAKIFMVHLEKNKSRALAESMKKLAEEANKRTSITSQDSRKSLPFPFGKRAGSTDEQIPSDEYVEYEPFNNYTNYQNILSLEKELYKNQTHPMARNNPAFQNDEESNFEEISLAEKDETKGVTFRPRKISSNSPEDSDSSADSEPVKVRFQDGGEKSSVQFATEDHETQF